MRTPLIAANWKMHKSNAEAEGFAKELLSLLPAGDAVEVAIAPPFTALATLGRALRGSSVELAAQNVHAQPSGAFTGEISVSMLVELGCRYVIVGHSERRHVFGESDAFIAAKLRAVQDAGMIPILCVGETLAEREAGRTFDVLGAQLEASLARADPERSPDLVLAYEPVWAIGTGQTATPDTAQEAHGFLRGRLSARYPKAAAQIRIQYGGSLKPENSATLMAQPDIDGALVGGASLDPASFCAIIRFSDRPRE